MTKNERERLEAAESLIDEVINGKYMKFGTKLRQFFGEYRHRFPRLDISEKVKQRKRA